MPSFSVKLNPPTAMFDYSKQIEGFRGDRVIVPKAFREKLYKHRDANRDRLITRLPERIKGLSISRSSFKPQGSIAVGLCILTKFKYEEYDIDDGLVLWKHELVDEDGNELSAEQVRDHVREALKDKRFVKQPQILPNAVRVFYKEDDEERHHVDFPVYRKCDDDGVLVRELASQDGWVRSDPTQVNRWFLDLIEERNDIVSGWGTQLRQLIQLLKRFCRSRKDWDLPNGMKLTMLVAECQPGFSERIDVAFRALLEALQMRLRYNKVIRNLAHPDKPAITRTACDQNVADFEEKIGEALDRLRTLDDPDKQDRDSAREAWDWVFKTDGYFRDFDKKEEEAEKAAKLESIAGLVRSNTAKTSRTGVIGLTGIANQGHSFYGDPS